ncbi:MAG: carotenoid 1,2-hydratase [Nannocystaceae bacterium]|nr:carotenoid 1,2-hydratase [bacterium]
MNAVLYRPGGGAWSLTEARPQSIERRADVFALSGSRIERDADTLTVHLDERTAPWGRALRGRVRIDLLAGAPSPFTLDQHGDHHWWPLGARARAEVELDAPAVRFRGSAYHDCNFGRVPLEDSFDSWNWSRAEVGDDVCITYDVHEVDGTQRPFGVRLAGGDVEPLVAPVATDLAPGRWGVRRQTRAHGEASVLRTLEDTPFYTRSLLRTTLDGRPALAMHESLSMQRFVQPWVQFLLPFRIRRGWRA